MLRFRLERDLPSSAAPAVEIVRALAAHGCEALLAGGCVRDLLRGEAPADYDVATNALPNRVAAIFPGARMVGAKFGVVLVQRKGRWIEVATFRSDGAYEDGRRPASVTFGDARNDASRRDFTVNGMFLDPLSMTVIDYVGGRDDLRAKTLRAIGDPTARFEEDHLRLLRGVRFAARLGFEIEPQTWSGLIAAAPMLPTISAERVREELAKMLSHASRATAAELMRRAGLLVFLWPGAAWSEDQSREAVDRLRDLPTDASFETALAEWLADRPATDVNSICHALACSNQQRDTVVWLVEHQNDLVEPDRPTLAHLKRLLAGPAFHGLRQLASSRIAATPDANRRQAALAARIEAIPADAIRPPPLVTGEDLLARGIPAGPLYKRVLDALYTMQLDERLTTREAALEALQTLLRGAS
ncbi:MAG: CCA tRNA nucleotidyltransferase [Phycisphaerae bacterium]